jgi:heptaprenyl diphosphate synthase
MVFLLYAIGWKETITVSIIRIIIISILFGNIQSLTFSLAGAVLSLLCMILLKKLKYFSCITVSITGGIFHNVGQIIAACLWTNTAEIAFFYLPVLLISGTIAGAIIGIIAGIVVKRLQKWKL